MTQFTAINRFAVVAVVWAGRIDGIWDDVMRRSERLIENCGDLQVFSHATLSIIRRDDFFHSVRDVLSSLYSLTRVVELWYEGVTDIFHDNLVEAFSRYLYKWVDRMLDGFK
jgi:hypothetical protein